MSSEHNYKEQLHTITQLLVEHRSNETWFDPNDGWGIEDYSGKECPKEIANKFMLRCLIDYQCDSKDAWKRGAEYIRSLDHDGQTELWKMITGKTQEDWNTEEQFKQCNLHRWHSVHKRIWQIAYCICMYFDGDARRIWEKSNSFDVLCRLYYIGAGEQISRMIVGALKDCGQIVGRGDVKADVHVCKVLGRALEGRKLTPIEAIHRTRALYPEDPWKLDGPLWNLGRMVCDSETPKCSGCYLVSQCKYAQEHSLGG